MGSSSSDESSDAEVDAKPVRTSTRISARLRNKKKMSSDRPRKKTAEVKESKKASVQPKPQRPQRPQKFEADEEEEEESLSDDIPISEQVAKLLSSNVTAAFPAGYEGANHAGGKNALDCTLILTEGDSAKTLAVAGLSGTLGRDRYGVFALNGRLLNVRDASPDKIFENAEINALLKIIGLKYELKYESHDDLKSLRYGKIMIMTDQDHDGSHIKGLIINFVHYNWPSLLEMNFIEQFITPIVKVFHETTTLSFYSIPEMEEWRKSEPEWESWPSKYYKGLGTNTIEEIKEYFSDFQRHRIRFEYEATRDDEQIRLAFSKKCTDQRRTWLTKWMEGFKARKEMGMAEDTIYGKEVRAITYADFINKDLVLYFIECLKRSFPSLVDGLKPGQRKVLYTCFKRNDKKEVKVSQLAGSVADHSAYHHGEQSLMSTIIGLAQNFVGSNNINLLTPGSHFGTRLQGGKDSADPRYLFTQLSSLTRFIFDEKDDPILKYLYDDNQKIEPEWYIPLIPMILVNGTDGIGSGWKTKIPKFNPREIVNNFKRLLKGDECEPMMPWYKNFQGSIMELGPQKYVCNGVVSLLNETSIEITELPVGKWTQSYNESVMKTFLAGSEKQPALISGYKEYNTDTTVKFVVSMKEDQMEKIKSEGLHKVFKLQTPINLENMMLFDKNGCLRKYESVTDVMKEHFELRMEFYHKRREYLLGQLDAEISNMATESPGRDQKIHDLNVLKGMTATDLFLEDLNNFLEELDRLDGLKKDDAFSVPAFEEVKGMKAIPVKPCPYLTAKQRSKIPRSQKSAMDLEKVRARTAGASTAWLNKQTPERKKAILLKSNEGRRKKRRTQNKPELKSFSEHDISILRSWLSNHIENPFPTNDEKRQIVNATDLNLKQVNTWFVKARAKLNKQQPKSFSKHDISIMRSWLSEHIENPYPTNNETRQIVNATNLNLKQVNNWFRKARVKLNKQRHKSTEYSSCD